VVAFDPPFEIPCGGLLLALAGALPGDVVAAAAWVQSDPDGGPLEPRFRNDGKRYHYRIRSGRLRNPLTDRYEWHMRHALDVEAMRRAATALVGEHDFSSFRASNCQAKTTVRRVTAVEVREREPTREPPRDPGALEPAPRIIEIDVEGDAFLKNMVRVMVGTLVEVGLGKRGVDTMEELIQLCDRTKAGPTAPARGLTLVEVKWPRDSGTGPG
jgi:tRNA pseudouridine38-40 synthase